MDDLIGLLVWVVIIGAAFHKNRKKRQEQQRRQPSVGQRTVLDSRSSQQEAKEESLWAELRQAIQDAVEEEKQQETAKKEKKNRKRELPETAKQLDAKRQKAPGQPKQPTVCRQEMQMGGPEPLAAVPEPVSTDSPASQGVTSGSMGAAPSVRGTTPFDLQASLSPIEKELLTTAEGTCLEPDAHRHTAIQSIQPAVSFAGANPPPATTQQEDWAKAMALAVILGDPVCKNRRRR